MQRVITGASKEEKREMQKRGQKLSQESQRLWRSNGVPSFDGKIWRLHAGKRAQIVYELEGA